MVAYLINGALIFLLIKKMLFHLNGMYSNLTAFKFIGSQTIYPLTMADDCYL